MDRGYTPARPILQAASASTGRPIHLSHDFFHCYSCDHRVEVDTDGNGRLVEWRSIDGQVHTCPPSGLEESENDGTA